MNAKILRTPEEAKLAAQAISERQQQETEKKKFEFESFLKALGEASPETGGFDEVASLLALSDEHFSMLSPIFLGELERSLNNTNNQMILVQAMNLSGTKIEQLREQYESIYEEIDVQMADILSRPKRDFLKKLLGLTYNSIADSEGIAKRHILIPISYCHENAKMPTYAHLSDAGMDIYATEDITIAPGETVLVPTGLKCALPLGYELQVRPKSGRCLKTKLRVANTPGTIDAGYRDEIGVIIDNIEPFIKSAEIDENGRLYNVEFGSSYTIGKGEKFAQLVLCEVPKAVFYEVESVAGIGEDRQGGFGSTGVK